MPEYCAECHTTVRAVGPTGVVIHAKGCRYETPTSMVAVPESKPRFVQISAWVRIEDAPKLLAVIGNLALDERLR